MSFSFLQPDTPDATATGVATPGLESGRPLVSRGRSVVVHASLVLFALAIIARAAQLQLVEGTQWAQVAERQQVREQRVVPPRGKILDATGTVLVESRELMQLNIAPRDLKKSKRFANPRATLRNGLRALGVHDTLIRRALDSSRRSVVLPATYLASDVERFAGVPGVSRQRVLRRIVLAQGGLRNIVGAVNASDQPRGGIEQELDHVLRGESGRDALMRDGRGNLVETPQLEGVAARPGHTVSLTINQSLQDIAERELVLAMQRTGSSGGDVVILDPRDGAVLVMASARGGTIATSSPALTEPYEPGSVMKPFLVARALDAGKTTPDEMINTENGTWIVAKRTMHDEHRAATMSVRDVIRFSSNIGVAKIASRFTHREQYEAMRDFGFGQPTGVPYPSESRGSLPRPGTKAWEPQTRESMATGYNMNATPLQIAAAYVALANGGELLQPVLVREIRDADERVVYRHKRRLVRRVLSPETARIMMTMLGTVVDSGTATAARLTTFDVAGKSGTARRFEGRGYGGGYNSTFAGMFPAQAPQYVFVARLIDPKGKIFGGVVAGGMVNGILQGALATRDASLDRPALAAVAKPLPVAPKKPLTPAQQLARLKDSLRRDSLRAPIPAAVEPVATAGQVVVALPLADSGTRRTAAAARRAAAEPPRAVPTVYGLDLRQATRTLHAAGFQVRIAKGVDGRTRPAAGAMLRPGATVVLEARP